MCTVIFCDFVLQYFENINMSSFDICFKLIDSTNNGFDFSWALSVHSTKMTLYHNNRFKHGLTHNNTKSTFCCTFIMIGFNWLMTGITSFHIVTSVKARNYLKVNALTITRISSDIVYFHVIIVLNSSIFLTQLIFKIRTFFFDGSVLIK